MIWQYFLQPSHWQSSHTEKIANKMLTQDLTSLIVLSILGIINAFYLYYKHKKKDVLACPLNSNCNAVINSKWSSMFGIKTEVLGLFFFIFVITTAFILYIKYSQYLKNLLLLVSLFSVLFSIYLIYLQKYVIKEYCFYCIINALIIFLIFINIIIL